MANIKQEIKNTIKTALANGPDNTTYWVTLDTVDGNTWAVVFGWVDGFEDGAHLCGKIAYAPKNSVMTEYDMDWLMPYDEETGEVYDTEISDPSDSDIDWWLNEWGTIKDIYVYPDEDIESATDVCAADYGNPYVESYWKIMNFIDSMILNNQPLTTRDLYKLQDMASAEGHTIEDIADANDCGECHTWQDLYNALKALHKSGERVSVTNIDSVESTEKIECVGHNDPGRYFDLVDYYDVWGNEEDGWEVNNLGVIEEGIWISDDTTEEELFNFLKDSVGYFNKDTKFSDVEIIWDSPEFIEFFDASNGYPLGRLQESYKK